MKSVFWGLVLLGIGVFAGSAIMQTNYLPARYFNAAWHKAELALMSAEELEYRNSLLYKNGPQDTTQEHIVEGKPLTFKSKFLSNSITVLPGVFKPMEADGVVLPLMANNQDIFKGKDVMEIGTGSGIISLYAAQLGARKVVSTDINPAAIASAKLNAEQLGYADVIDPRLVPLSDMSAYSVIGDDEQFDIIISNPPFALDLDADQNDALTDRGDLGFSIVRGLEKHLRPGGKLILLYGSLFYHNVMVKFARHEGYIVRHHNPLRTYPWAAETLFNSYLKRLLIVEGMDPNAFYFDRKKDQALQEKFLANYYLKATDIDYEPLLPGTKGWRYFEGMIVIERPADGIALTGSQPDK